MAQRICFLGRGGSGKSTVAQNLGHALALKGYRVLLVGNDISLSSTLLLRGEADISPALEDYREHYEIDLFDYVLPTPSGVYCLELGSIDPGVGCLARGISLIDEMLDTQGVTNRLQLDFILYDISGETPCTGYILPIREGLMQRCIIVTNGSFASVTTANSLLQAILRASGEEIFPVQLIVNNASRAETKAELADYARRSTIEILANLDYCPELEYSSLAGKTVFDTAPDSACAVRLRAIADDLLLSTIPTKLTPFSPRELIVWLRGWQRRELARRLAEAGADAVTDVTTGAAGAAPDSTTGAACAATDSTTGAAGAAPDSATGAAGAAPDSATGAAAATATDPATAAEPAKAAETGAAASAEANDG